MKDNKKFNIEDNKFYILKQKYENLKNMSDVAFRTFVSRNLLNLHETKAFFKMLAIRDYQGSFLKSIDNESQKDIDSLEMELAKNDLSYSPTTTVMDSFSMKWYDVSKAANSLLILEIISFTLFLLFGIVSIIISIPLLIWGFKSHAVHLQETKKSSLFSPKEQDRHIRIMKKIELLGIFLATFYTIYFLLTMITMFLGKQEIIIKITATSAGNGLVNILSFIAFLGTIALGVFLANYVRTKIEYDVKIDKKYRYSQASTLWTPENSKNYNDTKKKHIILGYVNADKKKPFYLRYNDLNTHHLILGGTGSGKSALIILPMILQFLNIADTGIITIDPKGDLIEDMRGLVITYKDMDIIKAKAFNKQREEKLKVLIEKIKNSKGFKKEYYIYQYYTTHQSAYEPYIDASKEIMIFDPKDIDCPYFNPLKGDLEQAQKLFKAIILAGSDENSYFDNQGEALVANVINVLKTLEKAQSFTDGIDKGVVAAIKQEFGGNSVFTKHVDFYLRNAEKMRLYNAWATVVIDAYQQQNLPDIDIIATSLASMQDYAKLKGGEYEHTSAVRAKVSKIVNNKYLNYIYNPSEYDIKKRKELDFANAIKNKDIIGIATRQDVLGDRYARVLGLSLILVLQQILMSIPHEDRHMTQVIIDEFQVFANDDMGILLNQGRSYLIAMHLATQTTSQIDLYTKGLKDTVLGNTFSKTFFSSLNAEDERYFKLEAGEVEEEVVEITGTRVNKGTGIQDNDHMMQKKKVKRALIDSHDLKYGLDEYGHSMSRYILAKREPQFMKFAFIGDWMHESQLKYYNKVKAEYPNILKSRAQKYLASSLEDFDFEPTGFSEMLVKSNEVDATSFGF